MDVRRAPVHDHICFLSCIDLRGAVGVAVSYLHVELRRQNHRFATRIDGLHAVIRALDIGLEEPIFEARLEDGLDVDLPTNTLDTPINFGRGHASTCIGHEVANAYRTTRSVELGYQDVRAPLVALPRRIRSLRTDDEPARRRVEQRAEDGRTVEVGKARPVDRSVGPDEY